MGLLRLLNGKEMPLGAMLGSAVHLV